MQASQQPTTAVTSSPGSSSVWGSNFTTTGDQAKLDSSSTWGSTTSSSSGVWGNAAPARSIAVSTTATSSTSTSATSQSTANVTSSATSISSGMLGWAGNTGQVPSQGQNGIGCSGGAQGSNSEQSQASSSESFSDGGMWQSIASGLSNLQKQQSGEDSAWGSIPANSNSSIASSISISTPNVSQADSLKGSSEQWNRGMPSSGWGSGSTSDPPRPDSEPGGWGTPEPIANPGTEGWGQPEAKSNPAGWNTESSSRPSTGWGPSQDTKSNQSNWTQSSSGWSEPEKASSSWGAAPDKRSPAWGAPGEDKPSSQWGAAMPSGQSNSQWGSQTSQPPTPGSSAQGAWSNPRPIGPPSGPSQDAPRPAQDTWAQAAGRGLPPEAAASKPPTSMSSRDAYFAELVSSNEGWGKKPIRQDTAWDLTESPKTPRKCFSSGGSGMGGGVGGGGGSSSSSSSGGDDNHWHQPNDGTAIWESSKESTSWSGNGGPGASAGPSGASNNRWGCENDSGQWNGPPSAEDSNMWNGPPKDSNQWARRNSTGSRGSWGDNSNDSHDGMWKSRDNKQWNQNDKPAQWTGGPGNNEWNSKPENWQGGRKDWESMQQSGNKDWEQKNEWGKKDDNVWDSNGTNVWGEPAAKVETGSWKSNNRPPQRPGNWGEDMDSVPGPWGGGNQRREPDGGQPFWGDTSKPPMRQAPIPGQRSDIGGSWGGPPGQGPKQGWSEPNKPDDNMPMWAQSQGKPGGWGDNQMGGQWPGAGAKPKTPQAPGWGESPDWMNPVAPGMLQKKQGASFGGQGMMMKQGHQMRSQLLQQLMDMGFKKEDAQKALINNNMNLENAIAELVSNHGRRTDLDLEASKGRQVRGIGGDDISVVRPDHSAAQQILPSMSMQNNTFSNAQATPPIPGSQPILPAAMGKLGGPAAGLQAPLSAANMPVMNQSVQQRIIQQQQLAAAAVKQQVPQSAQQLLAAQGQGIRGSQPAAAASVQQQLIQQQIVQQLQMAVQAGLISPQLLNQQLTPNMLVMLQQLLQLQQVLQRLVQQQQMIQQSRPGPRTTQLDQLTVTIQKIREQIVQQQQQINQAQQALRKQPTSLPSQPVPPTPAVPTATVPGPPVSSTTTPTSTDKDLKDLPVDLSNMQVREPVAPVSRSRLQQWKLPSPDREGSEQSAEDSSLNKAPGSKPIQSSHSSPNLQSNMDSVSSSLPYSDITWSTGAGVGGTSSWPSTSGTNTSTLQVSTDTDTAKKPEKEGQSSPSAASGSGSEKENDEDGSGGAALDIVEFVPGKLWQGTNNKTAEDDPYLTPGDLKRSYSVSTVKEEYISNTLGLKSGSTDSPTPTNDGWSSVVGKPGTKSSWSSPDGALGTDPWGAKRPPPGLDKKAGGPSGSWQQQQQPPQSFHRSVSWAPGDRGTIGQQGGWGGSNANNMSVWLVLKNIPSQLDAATLKTVCGQCGQVQAFHLFSGSGQAIVGYSTKEEGGKAQKNLHGYMLGGSALIAECVSDSEVSRLAELNTRHQPQSSMASLWSSAASPTTSSTSAHRSMWSTGGTSSNLWAPSIDDGSPNPLLPGDLLGGQ